MAGLSEARMGGGRSFGNRGYHSVAPRSAPMRPAYPSQPSQPTQPGQPMGGYGGQPSSGFGRSFMGGMAGGMLGSMLFGGMGRAGGDGWGGQGRGGIGLMDILVLLGIGYMVMRWLANRRMAAQAGSGSGGSAYRESYGEMNAYDKLKSVEPGPFASSASVTPEGETGQVAKLRLTDPSFDLESFKDSRMDDFMKLQANWNHRDLTAVASLLGAEVREHLEADIADLKRSGYVNHIESIAVRGTDLVETWQERGNEYATVRFRANLIDYTVEENSGRLVAGDQTQPVKFEEDWTFVRRVGEPGPGNAWKLSAIEA